MNKNTTVVVVVALGLIALCGLFPPMRQVQTHDAAGRGFLLSFNLTRANLVEERKGSTTITSYTLVEIDSPRFAAECVVILCLGGLVVTLLNSKKPSPDFRKQDAGDEPSLAPPAVP